MTAPSSPIPDWMAWAGSRRFWYVMAWALAVIVAVWLFLEKTPYGAIIKAGAHDSEMVRALGVDLTRLRSVGNRGLGGLANLLFGTRCTDINYGYHAFWRRCLPQRTSRGNHDDAFQILRTCARLRSSSFGEVSP